MVTIILYDKENNEQSENNAFDTDSWYTKPYFYLGSLMSSDYHPNPANNQANVLVRHLPAAALTLLPVITATAFVILATMTLVSTPYAPR